MHLSVILLIVSFEPSLDGSDDSLRRQNEEADRLHLERYADAASLKAAIALGDLVPVAATDAFTVDKDIGSKDRKHASLYRHVRTWTLAFIDRELSSGRAATGSRFRITSLVRTEAYQKRLSRSNLNAVVGDDPMRHSSHLTGATVDISWKGLPQKAVRWLRDRLLTLEAQDHVEATMEHRNQCFHVMVFPSYAVSPP